MEECRFTPRAREHIFSRSCRAKRSELHIIDLNRSEDLLKYSVFGFSGNVELLECETRAATSSPWIAHRLFLVNSNVEISFQKHWLWPYIDKNSTYVRCKLKVGRLVERERQ